MILSLLFLIILAVMATRTKMIWLSGLLFGAMKGLASHVLLTAESSLAMPSIWLVAAGQFVVNSVLGLCIAYLVVKRAQDWKFMFATTALAVLTFITSMVNAHLVHTVASL